ncbi:MAG: hypothetical protein RL547_2032 [Actinomycetota bacterium]
MSEASASARDAMRRDTRRLTFGLVLLAYVPALLSAPGRVPGDTKLSLYLDPGRLIGDALWTWDTRQFNGWVPHQNVGYLWPSGPFYWFFDLLGLPDWMAHRLWIGTLLFLAGTGVAFFARRLNLPTTTVVVAALVYQLSPYVLPYISRTSALLLPWSLLGWILGVSVAVARHRRARDIALWALLIASTGGLNATALAMIAPAPLVWLIAESRGRPKRSVVSLVVGLGIVAVAVNLWWINGLATQGRYGAPVLSYSETLPSTAATSTSTEVLRGLGYWLFYDRNVAVELTSAAEPYMQLGPILLAGLVLGAIGLVGVVLLPSSVRRPAAVVLVVGVILAVGPHPFDDPSPLWSWAADHPTSALSLALRSSTRAAPLVVLVLALGAGAAATRMGSRLVERGLSRRRSSLAPIAVGALAVVNLPALLTGSLVDPVVDRPENVPAAWREAAEFLDTRLADGFDGAVLLVPGIESAAYRWGYPVDPILPTLTEKRFVSRDWLPLGSAPYMDALYALDDAFQNGTVDPASVAPMARLLGADTIMVVNSHEYERFGTVRAERASLLLGDDPPGLTRLADFGEPTINRSDRFWSADDVLAPAHALPEITLWAVDDGAASARVTERPQWVRADGSGLVDVTAAGLVDGRTVVLDPATHDGDLGLEPASVIVTDSSRRRAHHWRSSQEVWGATEPESGVVSIVDVYDQRLPLTSFGPDETVVREESIEAIATGYGTELSYWPEYRPTMALDGDPTTAWLVGDERDPRGHVLSVSSDEPLASLDIRTPIDRNRWVSEIDVRVDGGEWSRHAIGESTIVTLSSPGRRIDIRIAAIGWRDGASSSRGSAVGFAEVLPEENRRPEVVAVPSPGDVDVAAFVFTRLVADPIDDWRSDPERRLLRQFESPRDMTVDPVVTARLAPRAGSDVVASLFGLEVFPADHLVGHQAWGPWSAHDGDASTAWWSVIGDVAPTLTVPIDGSVDEIVIQQPESSPRVVSVVVSDGITTSERIDVEEGGRVEFEPVDGQRLEVTIVEYEVSTATDRRTGRSIRLPVGISEIVGATTVRLDVTWTSPCRDDLLIVDENPITVRLSGRVDRLLRGEPFTVEPCGSPLDLVSGTHRLDSSDGNATGVDVDRIALVDSTFEIPVPAADAVVESGRTDRLVLVPPCETTCVVEGYDGWSQGWSNDPRPSASGRNVWTLAASADNRELESVWTPQRVMWIGLAVSATSVLFALAIVIIGATRRRHRHVEIRHVEIRHVEVQHIEVRDDAGWSIRTSAPPSIVSTLTIASIVALSVSPLWGLVPLAAHAVHRATTSITLERIGLALVALGLTFVIAQQIRTGADPGFGWPSVFERAHRPVLAGLVIWGSSLVTARHENR